MNRFFTDRTKAGPKVNFLEQCHRFWGKFEEIPVVRIRKNILNPKKPSTSISTTNRTPSPTKHFSSPEKIQRQNSVGIKNSIFSSKSPSKRPSHQRFVSIPSIHLDNS